MRLRLASLFERCRPTWLTVGRRDDRRAARQLALATALGRRALSEDDLTSVMREAAACVSRALGISHCGIFELTPDGESLVLRAGVGWTGEHLGAAMISVAADSPAKHALASGQPALVDDFETDARFSRPQLWREHSIVSATTVAIQGRSRTFGVLAACATRRDGVSPSDADFIQMVAGIVAMAVERDHAIRANATLVGQEQAARAEAESLAGVGRLMNESLSLPEVAQRIADSLLDLLKADGATVLALDGASGDLKVLAVAGAAFSARSGDIAFPRGTGLSGLAVEMRRPALSHDLLGDTRLLYHPAMKQLLSRSPVRRGLAVPLMARGDVIGVLALGSRERRFDDDDVRLASAFGDEAAIAMLNAQMHEELRSRLTASETLLAVSEQVAQVMDLTETMRRVARHVGLALGADMVGAFLADADERQLRPIAGWHVPRHLVRDFLLHAIPLAGHRILEEAWRGGAPVGLKNVAADPRVDKVAFDRFPHQSNLFCPMTVQGKPIGGLFVTWWEVEREFTAEELQLVQGISRQAGIAVANARLVEELRARKARLEAFLEVSHALSRILQPEPLLTSIARTCGELLGSHSVGVRLIEGDELVLAASWGDTAEIGKPRIGVGESLTGVVATTGEPLVVADPETDPRLIPEHRATIRGRGYRGWLGMPIKIGDRTTGVLSARTTRAQGFSADDVAVADALAAHAAVTLENARLYHEVAEARERLIVLSRRLVDSQEAERRHLARELHDEIGQALTGLKLSLEADADADPRRGTSEHARIARELVHDLIERVRGLSLDLRPAMLDDLGLVAALLWLLDRYTAQTRIGVHLQQSLPRERFSTSVETAVYRIVQEALTNVARHARASEAVVRLWTTASRLYVQIEDAGVGFDPSARDVGATSRGLIGMRERAALLGGDLVIDASPGAGVCVTADFPVDDTPPMDA